MNNNAICHQKNFMQRVQNLLLTNQKKEGNKRRERERERERDKDLGKTQRGD